MLCLYVQYYMCINIYIHHNHRRHMSTSICFYSGTQLLLVFWRKGKIFTYLFSHANAYGRRHFLCEINVEGLEHFNVWNGTVFMPVWLHALGYVRMYECLCVLEAFVICTFAFAWCVHSSVYVHV